MTEQDIERHQLYIAGLISGREDAIALRAPRESEIKDPDVLRGYKVGFTWRSEWGGPQ